MLLRVTVVVITYMRPGPLKKCLEHLAQQTQPADQLIVVDASPDGESQAVASAVPGVEYMRNPNGAGNMTNSRNVALASATGDLIAFLDDDAYPAPDYVEQLRRAYQDSSIGLACSRTLNGQPGEDRIGMDRIGKFDERDGTLSGNFAADPGTAVVDIDHGIGATMSFRRSTLLDLGGFREDFRGISGVREDADAFLRARALGYRAVFISSAVAEHVAAPQARGKRFDRRYQLWAGRNHAILLVNNYGVAAPILRRSVATVVSNELRDQSHSVPRRVARAGIGLGGMLLGVWVALRNHGWRPQTPRREDADAEQLRLHLARA